MSDVRAAVNTGLDGVSMYMATSEALRKHSHGKGVAAVIETAREVIQCVLCSSSQRRRAAQKARGARLTQPPCQSPPLSRFVKDQGMEVRFSCEDTFRSNRDELLEIYKAVDDLGVNRVGLADTVGLVAHRPAPSVFFF